jgi:uncharacterized membrane protein YfcA
VLFGLFILITDYEPALFDMKVFAISGDTLSLTGNKIFAFMDDNILNEIIGILVLVSSILVAFSKEKTEDEYISKIRLESLVWAVYLNYGILLFSFLFFYGFSFLWVMIFNMFTILLFFIFRFNRQIRKLKKLEIHEE